MDREAEMSEEVSAGSSLGAATFNSPIWEAGTVEFAPCGFRLWTRKKLLNIPIAFSFPLEPSFQVERGG